MTHHKSVLVSKVLEIFQEGIRHFFDGTVGAGGHAKALLSAHPEIEVYIACDRDKEAIEIAKEALKVWESKIVWVQGSFSEMREEMASVGLSCFDGILLDLGVSSMQIDDPKRGFSFQKEGPLDMRMDKRTSLTAEEVVNTFSEKELSNIFWTYGEERRSRAAARLIIEERKKKPFRTTLDLAYRLYPVLQKGRLHPATRIFQALRIYVNRELELLEIGLQEGLDLLCEKGRMAVISFHSLEDRLVKTHFAAAKKSGYTLLNKKPLIASFEEIRENPRSRSAKLRGIQRG